MSGPLQPLPIMETVAEVYRGFFAHAVHLPRLALQRWDETTASSVSGVGSAGGMREWYRANYFPRWPWALYES